MSIERQFIFWLGAAVLLALVLWALSAVMLPFAAGLALAYLLDPLATRLQKLGASRLFASLFIIGLGGVVIVVALVALAPTDAHPLRSPPVCASAQKQPRPEPRGHVGAAHEPG